MNSFPAQNSFVQAKSVQSQFAILTRDRDKFRHEMEAAERNRLLAQENLQKLKAEQMNLMKNIRTVQEELGNLTKKQNMLQKEKERLGRVTGCERKALEDCALHSNTISQQEKELKRKYLDELDSLNDENSDLLKRELYKKLKN